MQCSGERGREKKHGKKNKKRSIVVGERQKERL